MHHLNLTSPGALFRELMLVDRDKTREICINVTQHYIDPYTALAIKGTLFFYKNTFTFHANVLSTVFYPILAAISEIPVERRTVNEEANTIFAHDKPMTRGTSRELRILANEYTTLDNRFMAMVDDSTQLTMERIKQLLDSRGQLTAQEAVAEGVYGGIYNG